VWPKWCGNVQVPQQSIYQETQRKNDRKKATGLELGEQHLITVNSSASNLSFKMCDEEFIHQDTFHANGYAGYDHTR
jgi:hypothetical protein